ncbi:MAG: hypothetical protein HYS32_01650 [Candidatus Woesearchaeota archaeon]|nr:MAG: hypothetical protein HYS32_01650 [Candidatus Woesearchaeota archaeon]
MAEVDVSLLNVLSPIITFLLIWALTYAILEKSQLLKGSKNLHAFIGFILGMLFLFSPNAVKFVNLFTPWFIVLVVVSILILTLFFSMGWTPEQFKDNMGEGIIRWTLLIILIIIIVIALTKVFGPVTSPIGQIEDSSDNEVSIRSVEEGIPRTTQEGLIGEEVRKSLFSPRLLGAVFLLLIVSFAIRMVTTQE